MAMKGLRTLAAVTMSVTLILVAISTSLMPTIATEWPPDCMNSQNGVGENVSQKPVHSRKERSSRSGEDPDEHTHVDAVSIRAGTAIHNMDYKERICSFEELFKAMYICKKNVMWKDSVAGFVKNGLINCYRLHNELMTGKVVRTLLHKKASKERRKLRKLVTMVKEGKMSRQHADECYQAWRAHVQKGNCQSLLLKMDSYYASLYT